jgi:hypothetical protein
MSDPELIACFKDKSLPEVQPLDRATRQYEVKEAVTKNLANNIANPQHHRWQQRLRRIMEAMASPLTARKLPNDDQ